MANTSQAKAAAWGTNRRGFTIFDLVLIGVIISLVALVLPGRIDPHVYRADSAGRLAGAVLRGARQSAMARQETVVVLIDERAKRFVVLEDANGNCDADGGEQMRSRRLEPGASLVAHRARQRSPSKGKGRGEPCQLIGRKGVVFYPDGSADANLTLDLSWADAPNLGKRLEVSPDGAISAR